MKIIPTSHTAETTLLTLPCPVCFSLSDIFDCGQCFRFYPLNKEKTKYAGVACGRYLELEKRKNSLLLRTTQQEFDTVWRDYFDWDFDYQVCQEQFFFDPHLKDAVLSFPGIRILHQEHWETLCTFILSQNNNIPRIRSLLESICRTYGDPLEGNGRTVYSFPSAQRIACLSQQELYALKTGFRAKYLIDAAQRVACGDIDFQQIEGMSTEKAISELRRIKGVGLKVASCVLLFSFRKYDCFPIDVWMKRILNSYYPPGTDASYFGPYAGIAQQYLFHYERNNHGNMSL